jgi:uncharacterized membrane protein YphA (DoxX/SURF4 family)
MEESNGTRGREQYCMARRPAFMLSLVLALVYAAMGIFFLLPGVYHPFSTDTVNITHAHVPAAGVFLACAMIALILGGIVRLSPRR